MAISVFQNFGFLTPKIKNIDFFWKMDPKIQNYSKFSKNRSICYSATSRLPVYKISSQ